jgi:hypothetical protein
MKIENEEMVINMGLFHYDPRMIASLLGCEQSEVDKELANPKSQLCKLLQKGRDMGEYVIDLKLFDMAKSGDVKALDKLNIRIENRRDDG